MRIFLIIAFRNITRNKTRSLITILSIGCGLGAIIFLRGYIDGAHQQMKDNFTGLLMGHMQIHANGFDKSANLNHSIENQEDIFAKLNEVKKVKSFTARVRSHCLFSTAENSVGGLAMGIEPTTENKVSTVASSISSGSFISSETKHGIVIGRSLATNLQVTVGDKIIMMAQAYDGSLGADAFVVTGIIDTGIEDIDRYLGIVNIAELQETLQLGSLITDIVIRCSKFSDIVDVDSELNKKLSSGQDLEILTWDEISPTLKQWIDFDDAFALIFLSIVLIVIIAGILNTILMSLLERTKEFGVMLALGTKGYQLAIITAIESFMLGLLGTSCGIFIGVSLTLIFGHFGIPIGSSVQEAMASFFMSDTIYPTLVTDHIASSTLSVLLASVIISLYPAWKTSRLTPIKALQR